MFRRRAKNRTAQPVDESWNRIEAWFKSHAHPEFPPLRSGATEKQINAFEKVSGLNLPEAVKDFYRIHDGQVDFAAFPGVLAGHPFDALSKVQVETQFARDEYPHWLNEYGSPSGT